MIGIATCRQLLPWFGVSRPMLLNLLIGTIPIISLRGVQMCHKPVRLTLTFTEVRYKGTKRLPLPPDYAEIAKLCDLWLNPKQRHRCRLGSNILPCHHQRVLSEISKVITSKTMPNATRIYPCWWCLKKKTISLKQG